jgi:hypothetical protein
MIGKTLKNGSPMAESICERKGDDTMKLGKMISALMYTVSILLVVWFVWSWVDVIADNGHPNPIHSEYNLFVMMVNSAEEN